MLCLPLVLGSGAIAEGQAQAAVVQPLLLRTHSHEQLFGVRAAAFRGDTLAVIANPEPAVFLFGPGGYVRSWGARGEGPAELTSPGDVFWIGSDLLVWDFELLKLVTYDANGELRATRRFPGNTAWRLASSRGDTIITLAPHTGTGQNPGGGVRVVRQAGSARHAIVTLPHAAETVTLRAPGAPSLTRPAPFSPTSKFTTHRSGGIVVWDGQSPHLEHLDRDGQFVTRFPLPMDRYPVTEAEREAWVDATMPSGDFAGRGDIFKPLRDVANDQVTYPDSHPLVYGLMGDPAGGVWIQRTPSTSGSVWTYVDQRGPQATLRFRPGRSLLAVSTSEMVARTQDEMDVELLEVYRRPRT